MLLSFGALSITLIIYSRFFLKTFTPDGVEIINHLKGLKLFIKTTDIVNRDSYSLDDMEKLIPYSIIFITFGKLKDTGRVDLRSVI